MSHSSGPGQRACRYLGMENSYCCPARKGWAVQTERETMAEDFDLSDEDFEDLMNYYIEIGAVEVSGVLKDGQFIYKITDSAQELAPELWQMHTEAIDDAMIDLYQKGLVQVEYDEELNAQIKLSKEAKELMEEYGFVDMEGNEDD